MRMVTLLAANLAAPPGLQLHPVCSSTQHTLCDLIGWQFKRARDSILCSFLCCLEVSWKWFIPSSLFVYLSLSSASVPHVLFNKNNPLWASSDEDKLSPELNITGTLFVCSQASSLTSPVIKPPLPTSPGLDTGDESMEEPPKENLPPPFPTVSNILTIYIGSRSCDLVSPVVEVYNTRLNFFEHIIFLICLFLLMAAVTAILAAWMLLSIPLLSYITVSSFCKNLGYLQSSY